jgi:4-amino-4-deoxy-L-arabinose transferase-like glycosyltransferase
VDAGGKLLDRLQLMRLLSALVGGLTALCTFLFLRKTLPRVRWAWTVGTLGVALSPRFAFMSGSVNPDALLFAVSAALFYCIARAFRRGLTTRSAIAIGLVIAAGFLTKLNFIGLAPGALIGILGVQARKARGSRSRSLRTAAVAIAIGCTPVIVFLARNVLLHRPALGIVSATIGATHGSITQAANYIWQLYLPRLPGTVNDFPALLAAREIWFDGYVAKFGWLDTVFPGWVYALALVAAGLIAMLCARILIARRVALRTRAYELVIYILMALGLLVLVGVESYRHFPGLAAEFGQARYLLPLLPLLGAVLALGSARRRATLGSRQRRSAHSPVPRP